MAEGETLDGCRKQVPFEAGNGRVRFTAWDGFTTLFLDAVHTRSPRRIQVDTEYVHKTPEPDVNEFEVCDLKFHSFIYVFGSTAFRTHGTTSPYPQPATATAPYVRA